MRWEADWVEEDGGDFRLYIAGASPLVISDTVLRRRSTWPPIVSRRLPMGRWELSTTILNGGGQNVSSCCETLGGGTIPSVEARLCSPSSPHWSPPLSSSTLHKSVVRCRTVRHIVQTDDTNQVASTVCSSSSPRWPSVVHHPVCIITTYNAQ